MSQWVMGCIPNLVKGRPRSWGWLKPKSLTCIPWVWGRKSPLMGDLTFLALDYMLHSLWSNTSDQSCGKLQLQAWPLGKIGAWPRLSRYSPLKGGTVVVLKTHLILVMPVLVRPAQLWSNTIISRCSNKGGSHLPYQYSLNCLQGVWRRASH